MAEAAAGASPQRPRPRWRRTLRRLLIAAVVLPPLLLALYIWAALRFAYSEGERAGYVQKFSRKGWLCKTWEGQLAMVSLPGALAEVFPFTVRDEAVAARINQNLGERVSLHYEEHVRLPTSCFGDTSYYVTGVKRVEP